MSIWHSQGWQRQIGEDTVYAAQRYSLVSQP